MRTVTGYSQWFIEEVARAAREGHASAMRDGGAVHRWLYYRPNAAPERALAFYAEGEVPDGWVLGHGERMPTHLTVDQLDRWVRGFAAGLPILPSR